MIFKTISETLRIWTLSWCFIRPAERLAPLSGPQIFHGLNSEPTKALQPHAQESLATEKRGEIVRTLPQPGKKLVLRSLLFKFLCPSRLESTIFFHMYY